MAPGERVKSPVTLEEPFVTARDPPSVRLIPSALVTLSTVIGEAMVIVRLPGRSGTTTSSDADGSLSPDQLAAVLHCPSPASPSHVATASIARDSRCSTARQALLLRRDRAALRRPLAPATYRTIAGQAMRTGWNRAQRRKIIRIMHLVDHPPRRRARRSEVVTELVSRLPRCWIAAKRMRHEGDGRGPKNVVIPSSVRGCDGFLTLRPLDPQRPNPEVLGP